MTRVVSTSSSRLLDFSLWAATGVGLLVVGWGALVMVNDARTQGEDWDGLGLFFGGLMVVGGLLWSLPHVMLAWWLVRARRRGRALTPIGAASVALAGSLLLLLLFYVTSGAAQLSTLLVPICACVLVLTTGARVVLDTSR
ncbi:hypothetical protein [Nocardioides marmotae]|uniref:hypothetical protein n=1 Tax=Nocardioides marmotae TaxID=2663857 RepID=UPI0012B59792|nr:hypothetical protein [Nocardioides marmotae]MBC9733973.1 hypothetical protein [Nocardioides marmotae]MTB85076.1 hypothetical protein [Nocardioides marmotae]